MSIKVGDVLSMSYASKEAFCVMLVIDYDAQFKLWEVIILWDDMHPGDAGQPDFWRETTLEKMEKVA